MAFLTLLPLLNEAGECAVRWVERCGNAFIALVDEGVLSFDSRFRGVFRQDLHDPWERIPG